MSSKEAHRRRQKVREAVRAASRRKERWSPSGVVAISVFTLFFLVVAVLCVYAFAATATAGVGPFDSVDGRVAAMPAFMAYATYIVGASATGHLAFTQIGYLRRVARGEVPRLGGDPTMKRKRHPRARR